LTIALRRIGVRGISQWLSRLRILERFAFFALSVGSVNEPLAAGQTVESLQNKMFGPRGAEYAVLRRRRKTWAIAYFNPHVLIPPEKKLFS